MAGPGISAARIQEARDLHGRTVQYVVIHKWLCYCLTLTMARAASVDLGYGNFKALSPSLPLLWVSRENKERGNGEWTLQGGMR